MEKDKEDRYQSAGELRSELINIEKGIPTTERIEPKRKPITSREITVTFGLKKLFIPAFIVAALVITVLIIWQPWSQKEAAPIQSGKPSLAIMYFENNTGDENLGHWRKALSDLLITDISQSKHISVLSGDRLFNILKQENLLEAKSYSSEDLKEVASRGRATYTLQGNYTKAGDIFRINVMLHEASTGKLIGSEREEGRGEESIYSMVDELTIKIKEDLKLSDEQIASDIDKDVGKVTTSSPEAYKYYSEGWKYALKGDYQQCIALMKKAVAIDPEFAMAYRSMANAYLNMGISSERSKFMKKAFELSDRLSDRERYHIQGNYYQKEATVDKSIEAYNKLLELYPGDPTANNNLGVLYRAMEEWDKSIERLDVLIQNKDETFYPYENIAWPYMAKGMYDKAKEVLEYYLNNFSDNHEIHRTLAHVYLCQKKYKLALLEIDKAFYLNPIWFYIRAKGNIYYCMGDLIKAEKEYQKLLEREEVTAHFQGRYRLGALYLLQGKIEKQKDQLKQGIELAEKLGKMSWKREFHTCLVYMDLKSGNYERVLKDFNELWSSAVESKSPSGQRSALYWKGRTYLEVKSIDEAQRVADELKEFIEKGILKNRIRIYHHLMGLIELERENFSEAIEYFNRAITLLPYKSISRGGSSHALYIDPLAFIYYKSGDLEKSRKEYEKIISLTLGRIDWGDIYVKSFYMLGKIYEQKGDKANAIENYEKFLDLWKDADPGFPEVEDAKKRLAGLKNH